MRLISGATARSNTLNTLSECEATTFQKRIEQASLIMLFKILKGKAPQYLIDIHEDIQTPHLRINNLYNTSSFRLPYCRLETYKNSFFPRVLRLWNDLSRKIKESNSVDKFKESLKKPSNLELYNFKQVLYYYGKRWPSIHHARMRIGCSKLKRDLNVHLHVIDSSDCECGTGIEDAKHFFLECPFYDTQRLTLYNDMNGLMPVTVNCKIPFCLMYDWTIAE